MSTRRHFLKAVGLSGVAAALPVTSEAAKTPIQTASACGRSIARDPLAQYPNPTSTPDLSLSKTFGLGRSTLNDGEVISAGRWGVFYAQVKGGKVTGLRPFEYDYQPSINLPGYANLPYNKARIRYPYVRESFLKDGIKSRDKRGSDRFVRVSWDTALDLAAKHINRIYEEYGPSAVWGNSYGWQSTGRVNGAMTLTNRLLNCRGGFIGADNNYSEGAIMNILPYVVGSADPRSTSWDEVIDHSTRVVFWGCDPTVTNDIDWFTTLHNSAGYFRELVKKKDLRTYAINPLKPDVLEYMESHQVPSQWIAPRPGTDTAMMLGMIHTLIKNKACDYDFINRYCLGWDKFEAYVMGKTDGVEKTSAWAESKCGVPAKTIEALVMDFKANKTMIMMGWGIQRIQYGEQMHWMGFALASALGQLGLPGCGLGTNYHYSNGGSPASNGPFLGGVSGAPSKTLESKLPWKGSKSIPVARFVDCFLNPGKTIQYNGQSITYPEVRLVMWGGGNPFTHQPQTFQVVEAFKRPEVVIVSDINWTATARHADIVFPATTTFERNDITNIGSYSNDGVVAMKQAIEPQWEAKSDYWIGTQLAKRMGIEELYTEGRTEEQWIEHIYNQTRAQGERMGVKMPDFKTFWEKGYHLFDIPESSRRYNDFGEFRKDPKKHPLGTDSGLIEITSPRVESYHYDDCLGYPTYFEPSEGVNTATPETPLALMAVKSRYRLHSQLDSTVSHDYVDYDDREPCWIHPTDAKARGIVDGDPILVSNRRGKVLVTAFVTDRVMPGVVVVHHGAWFCPSQTEEGLVDVHGNSNSLTQDIPTSKLGQGNVASTALVQVKKWTHDSLPEVYVWRQPKTVRS